MQYLNEMKDEFHKMMQIKDKYGMDTQSLQDSLDEMEDFKVTSPVIGNFSTGKSTLINAIIGKSLLSVNITPETAVPTEICYGNNTVFCQYEEKEIPYSIDDLPLENLNVRNTDFLSIGYDCEFLKEISQVRLVDMPGFDTNIEMHNKAIDQYLPNSLAYLLIVSSDEPVLKENMTEFLKELKLFHIPVYVVITKSRRLSDDDLKECKELVVSLVEKILEIDHVKCACAESVGNIDVDGVKEFLLEIQSNAANIFRQKYQKVLRKNARYLEVYLMDRIDKKDLSTSELEQEREKLEKKVNDIISRVDKEKATFELQLDECIAVIRKRLKQDMEEAENVLTVMIRNGTDVTSRINSIVRNAIAISVKAEFEPRLKKYLDNIEDTIEIKEIFTEDIKNTMQHQLSNGMVENAVKRALPFLLAAAGAFLLNPVIAVAGAVIGTFADVVMNISGDRKKNRKAKEMAKDLIERMSEEAAVAVEVGMKSYMDKVNIDIKNKVIKKKNVLEKSLEDVEVQLHYEQMSKEQEIKELQENLHRIREWIQVEESV